MVKRLKVRVLFLCAFLLSIAVSTAQTVSLDVPKQVIEGQAFALTDIVTNGEASLRQSDAPKLEGCTLYSGPGVSTSNYIQIVNGKQSSAVIKNYTFTYIAGKAGTITIPAMNVNVGGKNMSLSSRSLTILPPDQARQNPNSMFPFDPMDPFAEWDQLMNELMNSNGGGHSSRPEQQQQEPTKVSKNDFLVRIILSKDEVYEKEALVATIKLYTKYDISNFQPLVTPQFEGFLSEEIDVSKLNTQIENYNGTNYYTIVLKKCILYPQKSGKLTINSGTYDVTLVTVDYVSYGGFYSTPVQKEHRLETSSNSAQVNVKPLPTPVPASFMGAVGDFEVSTTLVPEQLRTNEAAKYVLTVKGTGNIKHLSEPTIDFPATVQAYSPKGESDASFTGSNMKGTYTVTYTFIPEVEGELELPAWEYTYFNPEKKEYVTTQIPAYKKTVLKGVPAVQSNNGGATDASKIRDIRHIHQLDETELSQTHEALFHKLEYWMIYLVALLILITAVIVYRKHIKSLADVQGRRIRKARSVAGKRLRKARAALNHHNSDEFYAALSAALWGFLSDKLKIAASSLTRDNIAETLENAGASEDLVGQTIGLLDECEMARFTPSHSDTEMSTLYATASELIDNLNRLKLVDKKTDVATIQSRYEA